MRRMTNEARVLAGGTIALTVWSAPDRMTPLATHCDRAGSSPLPDGRLGPQWASKRRLLHKQARDPARRAGSPRFGETRARP
jgi:hypothetical protein